MSRAFSMAVVAAMFLTGCGAGTIGDAAAQPLVPTPTPTALEIEQQALGDLLDRLGLPLSSASKDGNIEVYVTDQRLFEEALRQANVTLPPNVVPVVVYEPRAPPAPFTPVPDVHFPQLRMRSGTYMAALLEGTLVIEDGCLRVQSGSRSALIIWQADYFLNNNAGVIEVIDRDGRVVGRVGEAISMGGGETPLHPALERALRAPMPAACHGPYWLAADAVRLGR